MKTVTIPAGYRLTVDSWENDADNPQQVTLDGLSEDKVICFTKICKLLKQGSSSVNKYLLDGNDRRAIVNLIFPIIIETKMLDWPGDDFTEDEQEEAVFDILDEIGLTGEAYFTRVCERFTVQYVKEPVVLDDVTERFLS